MREATLVSRLITRALFADEQLPIAQRADLYEGAALALEKFEPTQAAIALHTARLLREAEEHQLKFRELLRS
jgi:hypothetical protein